MPMCQSAFGNHSYKIMRCEESMCFGAKKEKAPKTKCAFTPLSTLSLRQRVLVLRLAAEARDGFLI